MSIIKKKKKKKGLIIVFVTIMIICVYLPLFCNYVGNKRLARLLMRVLAFVCL